MKVDLVFSLNETGSFENGNIHVVSSVRYRLYIWLSISELRKSSRLLDTLSQENYLLRTIIQCNNIFDTKYTFQRVPNQVENLQKFQGLGGGGL